MTKVGHGWAATPLLVLLTCGCVSQQAHQIEQDLTAVRDSLHVANLRHAELERRLEAVDERFDEYENLLGELRADHKTDVAELRTEATVTRTNLVDGEERLQALSLRVSALEQQASGARSAVALDTTRAAAPAGMKQAYERAYLDFTRGKYELAVLGFTEYLKDYPGTELADNAQFWIGKCHFVQGEHEKALAAFQRVLEEFPESNKAAGAMLQIGYVYAELGEEHSAIRQLKTLIERYPATPEAEHARAKLMSLTE